MVFIMSPHRRGTCPVERVGKWSSTTSAVNGTDHEPWPDNRLAVSSGLHQIPTGSLSKLRRTRLTARHEEEPWIRRTTTFSLPPPNSEIELAERIHAL
jgi:hypothetical protein